MKRYPFVLGATVAGLAGVLGFHARSGGGTTLPVTAGAGAGSTTTTAKPPLSASGATTTAPPSTAPPSSSQSATGTLEQYGYGELSVRVTVTGAKITDVSVVTLKTAETYSQQLAGQAIPMLRREVLSKQTARIYGVSGASYTSEAYAASVQSALDKLHFS